MSAGDSVEGRRCPSCGGLVLPTGECPRCLLGLATAADVLEDDLFPGSVGSDEDGAGFLSEDNASRWDHHIRGKVFGDYELEEELARGGMGVVYLARQISLNRRVVVKMIHGGLFADREQIERFQYEARAASKLSHSNIVPIYEIGEVDGQHFFTMKLFEGGSLADHIKEFDLPKASTREFPARSESDARQMAIARLMSVVAQAVHYAHRHGVIHRDLKPSNILMDESGAPHVTDFSLAKLAEEESGLTRTGAILGTPSYMSPEQASGRAKELTVQTDVYGLGAVLYHLLTGRPPFEAASSAEILRQVREQEPVRPGRYSPFVHKDLETICLHCLNKEAGHRYGSAEEVAEELDRFQRREPIKARPIKPAQRLARWCQRRPVVAGLLGAVIVATSLGGIATAWQWRQTREANVSLTTTVRELDSQIIESTVESGEVRPALGFLANRLREDSSNAYAAGRAVSILERFNFALPARPPVHFSGFIHDGLTSPDGTTVAVVLSAKPRQKSYTVWSEMRFSGAESAPVFGPAVAKPADLFSVPTELSVLWAQTPAPTGDPEYVELRSLNEGASKALRLPHGDLIHAVSFHPDGSKLASASWDGTARIWDTRTGEMLKELRHDGLVWAVQFNPTGDRLVTTRGNGQEPAHGILWETETWTQVAVLESRETNMRCVVFSPDGRWLTDGRTIWDGMSGAVAASLEKRHHDFITQVAFSPDGSRVATASMDNTAWVYDRETGRAIAGPFQHDAPVVDIGYDPQGMRVVTASLDGSARIWNVDSGMAAVKPFLHGEPVLHAGFAPEGLHVYTASQDGIVKVWDSVSGRSIVQPIQLPSAAVRCEWGSQGPGRLTTFSSDGMAVVWTIQPGISWGEELGLDRREVSLRSAVVGEKMIKAQENNEGYVRVIDLESGASLDRRKLHEGEIRSVEYNPTAARLLTASVDGSVKMWDAESWRQVGPVLSNLGPVNVARFSADGRKVLTVSRDGATAIWDAASGAPLVEALDHDRVSDARFGPWGRRVTTASLDGSVRVWDALAGSPLTPFLECADGVLFAQILRDGNRMVVGTADRCLRVYGLDPLTPLGDAIPVDERPAEVFLRERGEGVEVGNTTHRNQPGQSRSLFPLRAAPTPVPDRFVRVMEILAGRPEGMGAGHTHAQAGELWSLLHNSGASREEGFYPQWLRWFGADRSERPVSAWGRTAMNDFISDELNKSALAPVVWPVLLDWAPGNANAYARAADTLIRQGKDLDEAASYALMASFIEPKNPAHWFRQARACERQRSLDRAIAAVEQAVALQPSNPRFRYKLAELRRTRRNRSDPRQTQDLVASYQHTRPDKPHSGNLSVPLAFDPAEPLRIQCPAKVAGHAYGGGHKAFVSVPPPTISTPHRGNHALHFDGFDDYVQVRDFQIGTSDFTFEAWIKCDEPKQDNYQYLVSNRTREVNAKGSWYLFGISPAGRLALCLAKCGLDEECFLLGRSTLGSEWTHVAAVRQGTRLSLYINGALDAQSSDQEIRKLHGISGIARIGGWMELRRHFPGCIDELRIWKRARSADELRSSKDRELMRTEVNGLIAYYQFNEGFADAGNAKRNRLLDRSGHDNHGDLMFLDLSGKGKSPGRSNWTAGAPDLGGSLTLVNDHNGSWDASGEYPVGTTLVTWTVIDRQGAAEQANSAVVVSR